MIEDTGTTLITLTKITAADTYTTKLTRDASGNFEVFKNGVSDGTCTDTDITTSIEIHLKSGGTYAPTANLHFNWLKVY